MRFAFFAAILLVVSPATLAAVDDPEGEAAIETLKNGDGITASRVYKLCFIEDPDCIPLLRSSFERVMALPHGRQHPKGPAFCGDRNLSDQQLFNFYNTIYKSSGGTSLPLDYVMASMLTIAMPCR